MTIPTIDFRYSWIFDQKCEEWSAHDSNRIHPYPTSDEILSYIDVVKDLWSNNGRAILKELSIISGLPWREEKIACYVVGWVVPFSDPLTVPMYKDDPEYFIDVLVHELIHQLFIQEGNLEQASEAWSTIDKQYAKESRITRIHIPLHAMHEHIYHTFFTEERLDNDYQWISEYDNYKKSWDIVLEKGYKNIIEAFKKNVKSS